MRRLVALLVAAVVVAQAPVVGLVDDVDLDLVVESAAADIVDLVDDVPALVVVVLAVLGVRSELVHPAGLDRPILEPGVGVVPLAAEGKCFLGAVL